MSMGDQNGYNYKYSCSIIFTGVTVHKIQCKVIQDVLGFWIPVVGLTGFLVRRT